MQKNSRRGHREGGVRIVSSCVPLFSCPEEFPPRLVGAGNLDHFTSPVWEATRGILVVRRNEGISNMRTEVFLRQNFPVHLNRDSRYELLQAVLGKNFSSELPWEKGSFSFFRGEANFGGNRALPEALTVSVHCPVAGASKKLPLLETGL